MYRCRTCGTVSKPREQMIRHIVYRSLPKWGNLRGTILAEIPVCRECLDAIEMGVSVSSLVKINKMSQPIPTFVHTMFSEDGESKVKSARK